MTRRMLDAAERLLQREREALLAGQLDALPALVAEKARLVTALASSGPHERPRLEALVAFASRNQELLAQAIAGVRSAAQRLTSTGRVDLSPETYDRSGRRHPLGPGITTIERRA